MNRNMNNKRRQAGLTLIEAMVWMGVAGAVIGGVMSYQKTAQTSANTQKVMGHLSSIATAVRNKAQGSGWAYNNASLTLANLDSAGALPKAFTVCNSNSCTYSNGDTIDYTGAAGSFTLTYTTTNQTFCESVEDQIAQVGATNSPTCGATSPYTIVPSFK